MHGNNVDCVVFDEAPRYAYMPHVYTRQKFPFRLYMQRHQDGTWSLLYQRLKEVHHKQGAEVYGLLVVREKRVDLGHLRTKDAMKVLDGAWRMFKLEHASETA